MKLQVERFRKPNIRFGSGRTGSKIVSKFRLTHNRKLRSANISRPGFLPWKLRYVRKATILKVKACLASMVDQLGRQEKQSLGLTEKPREGHMADAMNKKRAKKAKTSHGRKDVHDTGKDSTQAQTSDSSSEGEEDSEKEDTKGKKPQAPSQEEDIGWSTRTRTTSRRRTMKKPKFQPMQSDDESWKLVVPKKPLPEKAVIYVGNLSPETTEDSLISFITQRSERVGVKAPTGPLPG